MIEFHLGLPNLFENLLASLAQADLERSKYNSLIYGKNGNLAQLGQLIQLKPQVVADLLASDEYIKNELDVIHAHNSVALSQHDFLGKPKSCFTQGKAFPFLEKRVQKACQILDGNDIAFHIALIPQFEYLNMNQYDIAEDMKPSDKIIIPSWYDIVLRIAKAAGTNPVYVWDLEDRRIMALALLVRLLRLNDENSLSSLSSYISNMKDSNPEINPDIFNIDKDFVLKLDAQYSADISKLKELDAGFDINLICAENIQSFFEI